MLLQRIVVGLRLDHWVLNALKGAEEGIPFCWEGDAGLEPYGLYLFLNPVTFNKAILILSYMLVYFV